MFIVQHNVIYTRIVHCTTLGLNVQDRLNIYIQHKILCIPCIKFTLAAIGS